MTALAAAVSTRHKPISTLGGVYLSDRAGASSLTHCFGPFAGK
jgi:hypothetical protein